jgi:hypothetical protein
MSIEAVQCPKCGAPLELPAGLGNAFCTFCGASLQITHGSSGHAMATLADIKTDTEVIATKAAMDHLRENLAGLEEKRRVLESRLIELRGRDASLLANPPGYLQSSVQQVASWILAAGAVSIFLSLAGLNCAAVALVCTGVGIVLWWTETKRIRQDWEQSRSQIYAATLGCSKDMERLRAQMLPIQTRLAEVTREMDSLVGSKPAR